MIDKFQCGHGHEDSFLMPKYVLNISAGDKISTLGGLSPLCRSQEISPAGAPGRQGASPSQASPTATPRPLLPGSLGFPRPSALGSEPHLHTPGWARPTQRPPQASRFHSDLSSGHPGCLCVTIKLCFPAPTFSAAVDLGVGGLGQADVIFIPIQWILMEILLNPLRRH